MSAITVIRLPNPGNHSALSRVMTTVARVDMALTDHLHDGNESRPYASLRRRDAVDITTFDDTLAGALLRGDPAAQLLNRVRPESLVCTDVEPSQVLRLRFATPMHMRYGSKGKRQYRTEPDPIGVFGCDEELRRSLSMPGVNPRRTLWYHWQAWAPDLPLEPLTLAQMGQIGWESTGREQRFVGREHHWGFVGRASYDLSRLTVAGRRTIWTLARFAEHRGIGKHTTYGMGRVIVT